MCIYFRRFLIPAQCASSDSPQEAGFGVIICDFGVFSVLESSRHVLGGVFTVLHLHRQRVRRHLLPAVLPGLTGDLFAKRQAEKREI